MSPHWSITFLKVKKIWKQVQTGSNIKRGQGAEACPELNIYDSFFIKWFTK